VLQVEGLVYRHAGAAAPLRFPDLTVPQGAQVLLRGPSGSGKSTLLALMAALLRPQQGHLRVAGADLATLSPRQADAWRGERLGIVPQRLHLSPGLSVRDNLRLVAFARGAPPDDRAITAALERLDVAALAGVRPGQLSAGQAQRVALARALLGRPRVLLADEPTANLDDDAARTALGLLSRVAGEAGATLVVATHDSRVVEHLAGARPWLLGASAGVPA
jgi:putative ABC transport system ATP-binding protein